jgi:hypothetical protein
MLLSNCLYAQYSLTKQQEYIINEWRDAYGGQIYYAYNYPKTFEIYQQLVSYSGMNYPIVFGQTFNWGQAHNGGLIIIDYSSINKNKNILAFVFAHEWGHQAFKANFRKIIYTDSNTKQKALVRYILSNLDAYFRLNATVNYGLMTIEHLYPQSPKQNPLPEEIIGQIGNLIFVTPETNGRLANKSFDEKIKILKSENYPMDDVLSKSIHWTEDSIKLRTDLLAEKSYKEIWKL